MAVDATSGMGLGGAGLEATRRQRLGPPGPRAQALVQRIEELLKPSVAALSGGHAGDAQQDALSFALRDLAELARAHPGAVQAALQQNPRVAQALTRATEDRGP